MMKYKVFFSRGHKRIYGIGMLDCYHILFLSHEHILCDDRSMAQNYVCRGV